MWRDGERDQRKKARVPKDVDLSTSTSAFVNAPLRRQGERLASLFPLFKINGVEEFSPVHLTPPGFGFC